ncbi:DUF6541 family protein [Pseudonocardia sp. ICBG1293]|uniref:DUF6541 family protein n=1 Tax=Pseudonocardia sp. ICBG1293 TaxID=2844382 RepID=UPI0035A937E1
MDARPGAGPAAAARRRPRPRRLPRAAGTGVGYVIDGPVTWWPWDPRADTYPGLSGIDRAPGFEPVLSGGGSTLYRITACGGVPARSTG